MSEKINIKGLDKAAVLAALYNAARHNPNFYDRDSMTVKEAAEYLKHATFIDTIRTRVIMFDLSGDTLNPYCYDRDNGEDAAKKAIESLRQRLRSRRSQETKQG